MEPWEQQEQPSGAPDSYFAVRSVLGLIAVVSAETARAIEAARENLSGRYVTFRDFAGVHYHVRLRDIGWLEESTPAARALHHAWFRARKAEEKAEKDWSTDD